MPSIRLSPNTCVLGLVSSLDHFSSCTGTVLDLEWDLFQLGFPIPFDDGHCNFAIFFVVLWVSLFSSLVTAPRRTDEMMSSVCPWDLP